MTLKERIKKIRLVCTDIDGVLTTGIIHYGDSSTHSKSFNVRDGIGIKWLQRVGIPVAFISGLYSPATINRAKDLKVIDCIAGIKDKEQVLQQLCNKYLLQYENVAYIGDDLIDLPILNLVGLACCPNDAAVEVQTIAHWIIPVPGGLGVMRLLAENILKTQGHWEAILSSFNKVR